MATSAATSFDEVDFETRLFVSKDNLSIKLSVSMMVQSVQFTISALARYILIIIFAAIHDLANCNFIHYPCPFFTGNKGERFGA